MMRAVTKRRMRRLLWTLSFSVMVGVVIGGTIGPMHGPPLLGLMLGTVPLGMKRVALPGRLQNLPVRKGDEHALAPGGADVDADRLQIK